MKIRCSCCRLVSSDVRRCVNESYVTLWRDVKSNIVYDISATSYVYFLTALPNDVFAEIIMYFIKNTGKELHC